VTRRLEDVHEELKKWVTSKTILVGHSFENDLKVLKLIHLRVLDTAVLYPHNRRERKNKLKHLSKRYLDRKIQSGDGVSGHNPVEDALAALELMKLKVKNGPMFGMSLLGKHSLAKILRQLHKNVHILGSHSVIDRLREYPADMTTLPAKELEIIAKVSKVINNPNTDLVWVQLMRGFMKVSDEGNGERVNRIISSLWKTIQPKTLMIIHTGRRRLKRLKYLQQRKIEARIRKGPPMTDRESTELKSLARDVTHHHFWLAVKNEDGFEVINSESKPFPVSLSSNPLDTSMSPSSLPTSSPPVYPCFPSSSPAK